MHYQLAHEEREKMAISNAKLGQIIDHLESEKLPKILSKSLKNIVEFDFVVIFGYLGSARPLAFYDDFTPARRVMHVDEYQDGPYLLDPFFLAATGGTQPGLWRLGE